MPDPDGTIEQTVVTEKSEEKVEEKKEPTPLEIALAAIEAEKAARLKAERDLSSLRGQVRSQRELEDSFADQITGINKHLELLTKGIANPDYAEKLPAEVAQAQSALTVQRQQARLQAEYARLADEFKSSINGEDGKPLFDIGNAPELAEARRLWLIGETGKDGSSVVGVDVRISTMIRAVAEATKAATAAERKRLRDEREAEKVAAANARKKKVEDAGELDLDTGGPAGARVKSTEGLTPTERIARGLAEAKKAGKRNPLYD